MCSKGRSCSRLVGSKVSPSRKKTFFLTGRFLTYEQGKSRKMTTEDWNAADGTKSMPDKWTGKPVFFLTDPVHAAPQKCQRRRRSPARTRMRGVKGATLESG